MADVTTSHFLGLLILLLTYTACGFEDGAPRGTCWTRYPKHGGLGAQSSPSPFQITFSSQTYSPGEQVQVTIRDPKGDRWFNGIQIAAFRDSGNQEEIVGQFTNYPEDKVKVFTCFGGYKNMATHTNDINIQSLLLTWQAPNQHVGNITFIATIVTNFETFWTDVEGKLLSSSHNSTVVTEPQFKTISLMGMVEDTDFSICGETKGCFLYPQYCSGNNCLAAVSFQHRPAQDDYLFEMYTTANNYISLGFSDDIIMGHDETVSCVSNAGVMSIQHGWNPHYHNERLLTRFLSEAEIKHSDGRLQCRFVLPRQTFVYHINHESSVLNYTSSTYDRDEDWHLMLAWGKAMPASDVMSIHKDMPAVTESKIHLKDTRVVSGSGYPILVKLHVVVMMFAWVFLSGIVTVVARHYREWMPKTRWFGTKVWFQVHRELAILIAVMTAVGIFVVFLHYGPGIRKYCILHAYFGLSVVAATGIQVIAGYLRPGPTSKKRCIFNWAHRSMGQCAHLLAGVTMFLAYDIDYIIGDMRTFGMAVLGVWAAVQLLWHLVFEILSYKGMLLSSHKTTADTGDVTDNGMCSLPTFLMIIYVVVLAGLFVACTVSFLLF